MSHGCQTADPYAGRRQASQDSNAKHELIVFYYSRQLLTRFVLEVDVNAGELLIRADRKGHQGDRGPG